MNWISPLTALYAGAVTVPLLLLLYFLKLKRQESVVPSTLLWKRAVQDLQVNAPFQRLRRNILLLLQMLMLLAILAALAGPVMSLHSLKVERYVLLIDNSASMNADDVEPTRLGYAKEQATIFVRSITEKSFMSFRNRPPQIMVITINDSAKVVCNFTSDTNQLVRTIEHIRAGDGRSSLGQGLALARAYCQSPDPEANNRSAEQAAQLVLFSDGCIQDLQNLKVSANELIFQAIGSSSDNVAITAMKARRSFENAQRIDVFVTLTNYNDTQVNTDLQLSINGDLKAVKNLVIDGKKIDALSKKVINGKVSVDFEVSSLEFGIIEAKLLRKDILAVDDTAWSIISAPRDVKTLLVTDNNVVLESALKACRQIKLFKCTHAEFSQMDSKAMEITRSYDVFVLDNHDGASVGRGTYLVFGKPPQETGIEVAGQSQNQLIVDYRAKHPVLNYVNMDNLFVGKCYDLKLPRDSEVLAEFDKGPAIGLIRRNNSTFITAGFDVMDSNWPFEPGFVLFVYNAVAFLAEEAGLVEKTEIQVAEPVSLLGLNADQEALFNGPGYKDEKIIVTKSGKLRLPVMERAGLYELKLPDADPKVYAVNLLDSEESDIAPKDQLSLVGQEIKASESTVKRFNMPIWPYIVAIVLLLVCAEWLVYNSKIRI